MDFKSLKKITNMTNSMHWNSFAFLALWNFLPFCINILVHVANCNHCILLKSNKPGIFLTVPSLPLQLAPWDLSSCLTSLCDYLQLHNHGLICSKLHTFSTGRWGRRVSSPAADHRPYAPTDHTEVGVYDLWSAASDESEQADLGSRGRDN